MRAGRQRRADPRRHRASSPTARFDDGRLDVGVVTARSRVRVAASRAACCGRPHRRLAARRHDPGDHCHGPSRRQDAVAARRRRPARRPRSSRSRCCPARRPDPDGGDVSGAVEIVGQPTLRRNDHWVRAWPLEPVDAGAARHQRGAAPRRDVRRRAAVHVVPRRRTGRRRRPRCRRMARGSPHADT